MLADRMRSECHWTTSQFLRSDCLPVQYPEYTWLSTLSKGASS